MQRMVLSTLALGLIAAGAAFPIRTAQACGGELPLSCIDPRDAALGLLKRAVVAVRRDKQQALRWFSEQSHDFRTVELYVFCIGPDHRIDAHPDEKLRGVDATQLVDVDGRRFGLEMVEKASEDTISSITYKWPKLGSTRPLVKQSFYTRVTDEVCGVGTYDED